jgi:hypothetical protein
VDEPSRCTHPEGDDREYTRFSTAMEGEEDPWERVASDSLDLREQTTDWVALERNTETNIPRCLISEALCPFREALGDARDVLSSDYVNRASRSRTRDLVLSKATR